MKRVLRVALAGFIIGCAFVSPSMAEYPDKPIKLIIPWPPGGVSDLSNRKLADIAARILKQPIITENRPGATATIGLAAAAKSTPDGYTIAHITGSPLFVVSAIRELPYDPVKDFTPIMNYSGAFHGIVVPADSPWKTLDDLLAAAKVSPGKLTYATSGPYDAGHFAMIVISNLRDLNVVHVPYTGGATALAGIAGRQVSYGVLSGYTELVKSGNLRLLAVLDGERMKDLPDVPTLKEAGIEWVFNSILGVAAPAGIPDEVRKKLESAFLEAARGDEFLNFMNTNQLPVRIMDGAQLQKLMSNESAHHMAAAKKYNIKQPQ